MELLSDLSRWFFALLDKWQVLVTGGIITAALVGIQYWRGKNFSWRFYKWVLLLFVGVALFLAWRDQYHQVVTLKQKYETSPMFSGELQNAFWGQRNGKPLLLVAGVLTNPYGPPSGTDNWRLTVKLKSSREITGIHPPNSGKDEPIPLAGNNNRLVLPEATYWPLQTESPVPAGAAVSGWFWAVFDGITEKDFSGAEAIVSFDDVVTGKKHYLKISLGEASGITIPGN